MAHYQLINSMPPSHSRSAAARRLLAETAAAPPSGDVQLSPTDLCMLQAIGGELSDPSQ